MRCILSLVIILATFAPPCRAGSEATLRDSLVAISNQSTFLEITDVLLNRKGRHYFEPGMMYANSPIYDSPDYDKWLGQIAALNGEKNALLNLLKDPDAKIRTLALAALSSRDDVTVLPAIAALANDMSPTYSGLHSLVEYLPERERKLCDQTVGQVAETVINFYLNQLESPEGNASLKQKTEKFIQKIQHYPNSAIACLLAITRSLDLDPASKAYADARAQIRANLATVSLSERAWIVLWLDQRCPGYDLYSQEELIGMFKDLGPDVIMQFLKGKTKGGTDPDAQNADIIFFLKFADRLLRPSDAEDLVTLGNQVSTYPVTDLKGKVTEEKSWPTGYWLIGAAKLQPTRAATLLRSAFKRYDDVPDPKGPVITFYVGLPSRYVRGDTRAELCTSLWEMCGESQAPFIADRFYDTSYGYREDPDHDDLNVGWRCDFLNQMTKLKEPPSQKMIAYLLEDKRVETYRFRFPVLRMMANYADLITGKNLLPFEEQNFFEYSEVDTPQLHAATRKVLQQIHDALSAK